MAWQARDHAALVPCDSGTRGSVLGVLVLLCGLAPVLGPTAAFGAAPASGTIVYSYYRWDAPATRSIRTVSFEGDDMNVLATGVGRRRSPTWSPDGSRIAYVAAGETDSIVLMANDGTDAEVVSLGNLRDVYDIDWSPGGRWIVFVARPLDDGRAGRLDLYSLDLIRRKVKRLTDDGSSDSQTSWSPDGEWILFMSSGSVTVISPDGTQRKRVFLTSREW
jgi:Tol biopolymer transport system component